MNIGNEEEAHAAVELWRSDPPMAQSRNLQQAIEKLELGQMYYEQKGNDSGVSRLGNCLEILLSRKEELTQESS